MKSHVTTNKWCFNESSTKLSSGKSHENHFTDISANSTKNDHLNANKVVHKQNYGDLYEFQTLERVWKQFACKPPTHIIIKLLSSFEWRKQNNTLSLEWLMAPEQYQVNLTPTISGLKKWGNLAELHHF